MNKTNERTSDDVVRALERVVNNVVEDGEEVQAYLCRLRLPCRFTDNAFQSNDIYKKFQSDFCKCVMRATGETPRYVGIKKENESNPEYAFCLFTKNDASLDKPEEYAEKGREIANGKVGQAGWGIGELDVMELVRDAPRFVISSKPVTINAVNKDSAISELREHLKDKCDTEHNQKTIFVSRCK